MITVIAKNNLGVDISLADIGGFPITASGQETLTDYFKPEKLFGSEDLYTRVSDGDITINNGSDDLSVAEALEYLESTSKWYIKDKFTDLDDTPNEYVDKRSYFVKVGDNELDLAFQYSGGYATTSGTLNVNRISFNCGQLFLDPAPNKNPHIASVGPIAGYAFDYNREEMVYGSFVLPPAFPPDYDMNIKIYYANDSTQTGDKKCRWGMEYQTYSNGEVFSTKTSTTAYVSHSLPSDVTEGTMVLSADIILDANDSNNSLTAGGLFTFRFFRDATHADDTMSGDAILSNIVFEAS